MTKIYVSTNCLKNSRDVIKVLKEFEKAEIENVELGSIHNYFNPKDLKNFNFNFIIHNYFPPPKKPFIFNLASQSYSIRKKSIALAKMAIDLCCDIESPLYTFHTGFRVDPSSLGKPLERSNIVNKTLAFSTYVQSVKEIINYTKNRGIKIGMEPNVIQKFNLIDGKNELALFADYSDIYSFYKLIRKKEVGILLDLGHTSVTSHWLKYDKDEFVNKCRDKVIAVHVSNNNGYKDQHKSLTTDCWQVSKLPAFKSKPIVLETMNLTTKQIKMNMEIVKNSLN